MDFRNTKYNRGIRNNNPGNIIYTDEKWQGKVPYAQNTDKNKHFEQFISVEYGLRALMKTAISYVQRHKRDTLNKFFAAWAPPHENPTHKYVAAVSQQLSLAPDAPFPALTKDFLIKLAKAISKQENAPHDTLIPDSCYQTAYQMIGTTTFQTEKKKQIAP